jgi:hypothetical protein
MKDNRHFLRGLFVIVLAVTALAGCKKERTFVLEEFEDYFYYSDIMFKDTDYTNSWLLLDSSDYKTVLKELRNIYGREGEPRNTIIDGPKPHQAALGIFEDDVIADRYIIILEVGSDVKRGGGLWNWRISDTGFDEGMYKLKMRLSDEEYKLKMLGF